MWQLYQNSQTWRTRPSSLLEIEDEYAAYCVDEAVAWFGNEVEGMLSQVQGKTADEVSAKRELLLNRILKGKSQFAEPPITKGN